MEKAPNFIEPSIKKEKRQENKIFELEMIEEFSPEKQKEIMTAAIDSGVGYIIPDKSAERYNANGNFCKEFCLPSGLFIPKDLKNINAVASFMQPIGVAKDFSQLEKTKIAEGLQEYYRSVEKYYDLVKLWLCENEKMFPQKLLENLELKQEKNKLFFCEASIFRADALINAEGELFVCDPNTTPLMGGSINFLRKYLNLPNGFELYEKTLAKYTSHNLLGGILTNTEYPNWTQHEYTARCIRARNGNFHTIHPDFLDSQGLLDDVAPNILIRHIRENVAINSATKIINPSGVSLFESPIWSALLPLLEKKDAINKSFVPGLLVRQKDDNFECATKADIKDGRLTILWAPLIKKEGNQPELSWAPWTQKDYSGLYFKNNFSLDASKNSRWFVKGVQTSGSKAVGFLNEEQALPGQLKRFLRNKKEIFGDIFILQPFVPSLMNIQREKKRTKSDLFLLGDPKQGLKHISTSIMVSSPSTQKVHGGSGTQLIVCV